MVGGREGGREGEKEGRERGREGGNKERRAYSFFYSIDLCTIL